jgi:hypothetical protein
VLSEPIPKPFGGEVVDVFYIMPYPKQKEANVYSCGSAFAKGLARWFNKPDNLGNKAWLDRKELYKARLGGEGKFGPALAELSLKFSDFDEAEEARMKAIVAEHGSNWPGASIIADDDSNLAGERGRIIKNFLDNIQAMKASLRPKATRYLEDAVIKISKRMRDRSKQTLASKNESSSKDSALQEIKTVAALMESCDGEAAADVKQDALDTTMLYKETGARQALHSSLLEFTTTTPADFTLVCALKEKYDLCRNNHDSGMVRSLVEARPAIFDAVVDTELRTKGDVNTQPGLQFLESMLEDPAILEAAGDGARKDLEVLVTFAWHLYDIKKASTEFSTQFDKDGSGGASLDTFVDVYTTLEAERKVEVALHNQAFKAAFNRLKSHAGGILKYHEKYISLGCVGKVTKALQKVEQCTKACQLVARGGEKGKSWYREAPKDLVGNEAALKTFLADAASKACAAKTEAAMKDGLTALAELDKAHAKFDTFLPLQILATHDVLKDESTIRVALTMTIQEARVTKCEIFLARVVTKANLSEEQAKSLVANITSAFTRDLSDWNIPIPIWKEALWIPLFKHFEDTLCPSVAAVVVAG